MDKDNLTKEQKRILTNYLEGFTISEKDIEIAKQLMVEQHMNEVINTMLISGILIREYLDFYKKILEYGETEKYKFFEKYDSVIDLEECRSIIKDIEEGKDFTKDSYGKELQIISLDILKEENVYIVKEFGKPYRLSVGKSYSEFFNSFTSSIKINGEIMFVVNDFQDMEDSPNVILNGRNIDRAIYPNGIEIRDTVVITGLDYDNEYDLSKNITSDQLVYIISQNQAFGFAQINIDCFS